MERAVQGAIDASGFTLFGGFAPGPEDALAADVRTLLLIGNAGAEMFRRYLASRAAEGVTLDAWTRHSVDALAAELGARAVYPFDQPFPPIQAWARRAGIAHASPLGLNIHPRYGLWHAYRAALLFTRALDLPAVESMAHPCDACAGRPCLQACPVQAFDGARYDTRACVGWLSEASGADCMDTGCRARHACPVGRDHRYEPAQANFHMRAFRDAFAAEV